MSRVYYIVNFESVGSHRGVGMCVANPVWPDNWWELYFPGASSDTVAAYRLDGVAGGETTNALFFNEELSGADGMHFTLICEPQHSSEDVAAAKADLRGKRDVTGFTVIRLTAEVPFPGLPAEMAGSAKEQP